jgi:type IV pilus assembly protein PilB
MSQDARRDEEQATRRRAQILGMNYEDTFIPNKQLFKDILTPDEMRTYKVTPIYADEHHINFGITNTTSQRTMQELRQRFLDQRVSFALISDTGFKDYIKLYDPPKEVVYQDVKISKDTDSDLFLEVTRTLDQVLSDDILAYLVKQTYQLKGSDIHLECQKEGVRVRLRVDGVLHPVAALTYEKYKQLLSSIAVAANISTGSPEPQTGHINRTYRMASEEDVNVNLRVEAIPTAYGLDVVMRLFNFNMSLLKLDNLGLNDRERGVVDNIISHPSGLLLAVGPTGSGKTTTLYSLISTLNSPERKIITLEDPIEYVLEGVMQIPVRGDENEEGFADKFRAVLRLDPDVVMVGEIRDRDTARTALQAALTGHLVLSTFHAQSSAAALTRLIDFVGVNPLFASAIQLIMSQRLIRRLDDSTKEPYKPDAALKKQLQTVLDTLPPGIKKPSLDDVTLYKAKPTKENPFGYTGQFAIREQLLMTPSVRKILSLPPNEITTEMLEKKAVEDGMITMLHDGILKVLNGETTLDEVYRVVG